MKNTCLFLFIAFCLGCNNRIVSNKQIYQEKFNRERYDSTLISDTLFANTLNLIQEIKGEILAAKADGKNGTGPICYVLAIRSDLGGRLEKYLSTISTFGFGKLNNKYQFYDDCNQLDFDKALFYLTNLERDILVIYLRVEKSQTR